MTEIIIHMGKNPRQKALNIIYWLAKNNIETNIEHLVRIQKYEKYHHDDRIKLRFLFNNNKDAILFKLVWSGSNES